MSKLFDVFRRRPTMRQIVSLAQQIADQSQQLVWDRVRELIFDMDLPEARGYVRVRAAAVIRQRLVVAAHGDENLCIRTRPMLSALATERVVQLVITDLVSANDLPSKAAA